MERSGMLFLAVMLFLRAIYADYHTDEGNALLALKKTIRGDPNGATNNWTTSINDHCKWAYVTCNGNNRVTEINIPNMGLSAELVADLSALTNLQYLVLSNNNIRGQIHPGFEKLSALSTLDLHGNRLDGIIPNVFNKLPYLLYLDLSSNKLSGGIPMTLASDISLLGYINISNNILSGKVPQELKSSAFVDTSHNQNLCGEYAVPNTKCPT